MSLQIINVQQFTVSEIQPGQEFLNSRSPRQGQRSNQVSLSIDCDFRNIKVWVYVFCCIVVCELYIK